MLPSDYLKLFLKVFTVLIIITDIAFAAYIPYLYYSSNIRNRYLEGLIIFLVFLYVVNLLAEVFTLLVIIYLIYNQYGISQSINDVSYTSFYKFLNYNPVLFLLIGTSFIIYVFSFLLILIITNQLIELAQKFKLTSITNQLEVLAGFQKMTFIIFLIFFFTMIYVDLVERAYKKITRYKNDKYKSSDKGQVGEESGKKGTA